MKLTERHLRDDPSAIEGISTLKIIGVDNVSGRSPDGVPDEVNSLADRLGSEAMSIADEEEIDPVEDMLQTALR